MANIRTPIKSTTHAIGKYRPSEPRVLHCSNADMAFKGRKNGRIRKKGNGEE